MCDIYTDVFVVPFRGVFVHCESLDDAVAIKSANLIDDDHEHDDWFTTARLENLARVLARYNFPDAAEWLRRKAARIRAAHLLSHAQR